MSGDGFVEKKVPRESCVVPSLEAVLRLFRCSCRAATHTPYRYNSMASLSTASNRRVPTARRTESSVEERPKDNTELRLEKALFGDDAGFLEALSAERYGQGKELQTHDNGSDDSVHSDGSDDLADVADEDVSWPSLRQ
jgi:hypothetical protein